MSSEPNGQPENRRELRYECPVCAGWVFVRPLGRDRGLLSITGTMRPLEFYDLTVSGGILDQSVFLNQRRRTEQHEARNWDDTEKCAPARLRNDP